MALNENKSLKKAGHMSVSTRVDSFSSSSSSYNSSSFSRADEKFVPLRPGTPEHKKQEDVLDKTESVAEACLQAKADQIGATDDRTKKVTVRREFLIEDLNARIDEINEGIVLLKLQNDQIKKKYEATEDERLQGKYIEELEKNDKKIKLMEERIQYLEDRKYAIFRMEDDSDI